VAEAAYASLPGSFQYRDCAELAALRRRLCGHIVLKRLIRYGFDKPITQDSSSRAELMDVLRCGDVFLRLGVNCSILDKRLSPRGSDKVTKAVEASGPEFIDLTNVAGDGSLMATRTCDIGVGWSESFVYLFPFLEYCLVIAERATSYRRVGALIYFSAECSETIK
jgi:hypothetical protein